MAVHRVISRWDFPFQPQLMDRPGEIYSVLGHNEWPDLQEHARHTYIVKKIADDRSCYQTISFGPTTIAFSIEWRAGIATDRLADNEDLLSLLRSFDKVRDHVGITVIKRAGIRFYEFDRLELQDHADEAVIESEDQPQVLVGQFLKVAPSALAQSISEHAGPPIDIMWRQVGSHEDGTHYRVSCGPFRDSEKGKFFEEIDEEWSDSMKCDFISDCDFSENDFELRVSAKSWATPMIRRHSNMIRSMTKKIRGDHHE